MKRRLLNVLTAGSLPLCAAAIVLWVRSYFWWESLDRYPYRPETQTYRQQSFNSSRGMLWAQWVEEKYLDKDFAARMLRDRDERTHSVTWSYDRSELWGHSRTTGLWERLGFKYDRTNVNMGVGLQSVLAVCLPYWLLTALFAVAPARWTVVRLRTRRRVRGGLCPRCGYDLRATPGQCPECGASGATPRAETQEALAR